MYYIVHRTMYKVCSATTMYRMTHYVNVPHILSACALSSFHRKYSVLVHTRYEYIVELFVHIVGLRGTRLYLYYHHGATWYIVLCTSTMYDVQGSTSPTMYIVQGTSYEYEYEYKVVPCTYVHRTCMYLPVCTTRMYEYII